MNNNRKDSKGRKLHTGESQRPDGRYEYKYKGADGKRKTIYSMDIVELRELEKKVQKDLEDGINTDRAKMTLNDLFDAYMETKVKIADTTKTNYRYVWDKEIRNNTLGHMCIETVRKSDILKLYASLSKQGYKNGSLQLIQNILFPCFQLAVDDNVIRLNPCKGCMAEYTKNDAEEKVPLSVDEQQRYLAFLESSNRYKVVFPIISFMIGTATRVSETIGLTWDDVDMKNRTITINHQLIYKKIDEETRFRKHSPKTSKGNRIIPMTDDVYRALLMQKKQQLFMGIPRDYVVDGLNDFVFTTSKGTPYQPNMINRFIVSSIEAYNRKNPQTPIHHISAHGLRHTGCTRMAERGVDVKVLQYIMGHENITTTMDIYNHVDVSRVAAEMRKIDNISVV